MIMTYDPNDLNRERFEDERKVHVNQPNDGMGGTIAVAVVVVLLLVGGIFFIASSSGIDPSGPQVTQNNTALPAPVIEVPAAPAPDAPPAVQPVTPPAEPPANNP